MKTLANLSAFYHILMIILADKHTESWCTKWGVGTVESTEKDNYMYPQGEVMEICPVVPSGYVIGIEDGPVTESK